MRKGIKVSEMLIDSITSNLQYSREFQNVDSSRTFAE